MASLLIGDDSFGAEGSSIVRKVSRFHSHDLTIRDP
jgi:hypothetical protein